MSEAVVDDLEAVEIEVQHRETCSRPFLEFGQPTAQPLDEHGAVAESGQWIEETGSLQTLAHNRLLCRVRQRSSHANGATTSTTHRDTAQEETAIRPIFVKDPVLVRQLFACSGQTELDRLVQPANVITVNTRQPLIRTADARSS